MHAHTSIRTQRGVAMVISLVMLLLVSLVVLQAARSSNLEVLIGNNTQQTTQALMNAENSVAMGEIFIEEKFAGGSPLGFDFDKKDGVYLDEDLELYSTDWTGIETEKKGKDKDNEVESEYIVEYIGSEVAAGSSLGLGSGGAGSNNIYLYRVSGRGDAGIGGARVVQTIYATAD